MTDRGRRGEHHELAELIDRGAGDDSCSGPTELGIRFHRLEHRAAFRKTGSFGPSMTFVARGRQLVRFGKRELSYDPSHYIVMIGDHGFHADTVGTPWRAATIDLPVDLIVKTQLALATQRETQPCDEPAFVSPFDRAMRDCVTRLLTSMEDPIERRVVAPLVREELVFRLLRSDAASIVRAAVSARDAGAIHEAMRYIRASATISLSVESIARHVAMSPSHFAHRFRAVARVSPMRYLKQCRLDDARRLMLGTKLRVTEVATRVGYHSTSQFSREFKQAFGISPAELGKRIAESGMSTAAPGIAS